MRPPSLVVLVNGREASAAGVRAQELFTRSRSVSLDQLIIRYRDQGKLKSLLSFVVCLARMRPKVVYVVDMAASGVIAGVIYRCIAWRTSLIIDTGDAISALARKMGDRGRLAIVLTDMLEKLGQAAADLIIVRGSKHLDHLGRHAGKATVIQDGVNANAYEIVEPVSTWGTFNTEMPLVVGVVGTLYWNADRQWCYGMELVEAIGILKDRPVRGVIVGDGNGLCHLKQYARQLGIEDRIQFVDRVAADELLAVLGTMHVALSTQTNDVVGQVRTTGKLPLYLASGRYVLASRVGEACRLLPDVMLIDYTGEFDSEYPKRLATAIDELVRDKSRLRLAAQGPQIARQLDYDVLAARLDCVLSPLLGKPDSRLNCRLPVIYLALGVHRKGGMERAAYEIINRLKSQRQMIVIARECAVEGICHKAVWAPRRPAMLAVTCYRWLARYALRQFPRCITTGIGGSGGPVDVVVAQYCQEAFRQRIGAVRANGPLEAWWHRRNMARFCAEERVVYTSAVLKRIIAVSHGVGRELVEFYGVDPGIIRHIPNGVDLSLFRPAKADERRQMREQLELPCDGLLACFVGGDWRRKGLRYAIEALRGADDVRLVVVGAGNENEFGAYAKAAGVQARVHFVGKRPEPQNYMRASDVYVFPSRYEAFSLSCIEAAACGLPMLVTKINGVEELVEDGANGFFVEHCAESIASRLRQLCEDSALRARLSARAAEDAKRYSWDCVAAEHKKVYEELDAELERSEHNAVFEN